MISCLGCFSARKTQQQFLLRSFYQQLKYFSNEVNKNLNSKRPTKNGKFDNDRLVGIRREEIPQNRRVEDFRKDSPNRSINRIVLPKTDVFISASDVFHSTNLQGLDTVLDIYRFSVTQFHQHNLDFGHTTTNAYEDASFLILHELALPNDSDIRSWFQAKLTRKERDHLLKLIRQRCIDRIPSPYLVGGCYQQGLYFFVDQRVLIPRSFIGEILFKWQKLNSEVSMKLSEKPFDITGSFAPSSLANDSNAVELDYNDYIGEIIEEPQDINIPAATAIPPSSLLSNSITNGPRDKESGISKAVSAVLPIDISKVHTVLDMCTGSGCLSILAAKFLPNVQHVDAVDLSFDALEIAEENVDNHGLDEIVDLHQGDLFEALSSSRHGYYDLIISNPPYVTEADMTILPEEYMKEPAMALVAGDEGIDIIETILQQAPLFLRPDGYLLCEIGQTAASLERKYGSVFASKRHYKVTEDLWQKKIIGDLQTSTHLVPGKGDNTAEQQSSVLWIDTELSNREVFLASKPCLELIAKKIAKAQSKTKKSGNEKSKSGK